MPHSERHPITGCLAQENFLGGWLIDAEAHERLVAHALQYDLAWLAEYNAAAEQRELSSGGQPALFQKLGNVAQITISGPTTKHATSFSRLMGGTSTNQVIRALRAARMDAETDEILLHIDGTPGGTVHGAFDLADEIKKTNDTKRVTVHADDQCTSAGQLFASQAGYVSANKNAIMGSIGVRSYMVDTSEKMARDGIRVIPIGSGKFKTMGMPGVKITDEQIAKMEAGVKEVNELFIDAVASVRKIKPETIRDLEAGTFLAARAKELGLIDEICRYEDTLNRLKTGGTQAVRNPVLVPIKQVAQIAGSEPARRTAMAFTAQQLTAIRAAIPGTSSVTDDQMESFVANKVVEQTTKLSTAEGQTAQQHTEITTLRGKITELQAQIPHKVEPGVLNDRLQTATDRIQMYLDKGYMMPAQAAKLTSFLGTPGIKEILLSPVGPADKQEMAYKTLLSVFEENKPNGIVTPLAGAQPAPKETPGTPAPAAGGVTATHANGDQSLADVNKARDLANLKPWTQKEYDDVKARRGE